MCNIVAIFDRTQKDVASRLYVANFAGQHRGQESTGIATSDGNKICVKIGAGEVTSVFRSSEDLNGLFGFMGISHNRYATEGSSQDENNFQPFWTGETGNKYKRHVAISLNGNIVNSRHLRSKLEADGCRFNGTTDTEMIAHRLCRSKGITIKEIMKEALAPLKGAYSLAIMFQGVPQIVVVRDPWGFRPLVLGEQNGTIIASSETCSLRSLRADYRREVKPGEMVILDKRGFTSTQLLEPQRLSRCIFETIYFSRPDSKVFGADAALFRMEQGRMLAKNHPAKADLVVPVPDSANFAAIGFSRESGTPFVPAIIRSHYVGRTFILPSQKERYSRIRSKFGVAQGLISGKRVVLIDDSIVRANTSRKIVKRLKKEGAKEVHVRIASAPIIDGCSWGMDFPDPNELGIVKHGSVKGLCKEIGADSLDYLTPKELLEATSRVLHPKPKPVKDISGADHGLCMGCFTKLQPLDRRDAPLSKDYNSEERRKS